MRKIIISTVVLICIAIIFVGYRIIFTLKAITFDFADFEDVIKAAKANFIDILTSPENGGFKATGTVLLKLDNVLSDVTINSMKVDVYYTQKSTLGGGSNKVYFGYLSRPETTKLKKGENNTLLFNMYINLDNVAFTLLKNLSSFNKDGFTYISRLNLYGLNVASEGKF